MNISSHHTCIFYDLTHCCFRLEVLRKHGCLLEGVLHLPKNRPVKLNSQDLLQIRDKEFYFLLPCEEYSGWPIEPRHYAVAIRGGGGSGKKMREGYEGYGYSGGLGSGSGTKSGSLALAIGIGIQFIF
ncbi:putative SMAD/FHA domain-containing protein [Rosa chinensis]|uniref:Putative SMAD/FHA domain-containing protein n=1 Tax=Rosa chinensis TaxID=74649 RepID=A0A2P6S8K4_ROSCH|nr:putative SMAD/FHA domain-containing protein [Rosa chinensis]